MFFTCEDLQPGETNQGTHQNLEDMITVACNLDCQEIEWNQIVMKTNIGLRTIICSYFIESLNCKSTFNSYMTLPPMKTAFMFNIN